VWTAEISDAAMPERIASRVKAALDHDGFSLVYQPVVRLTDGQVAYFESLARLHGAAGPALTPAEFLPAVERLGLMPDLTRRVVEVALHELAAVPGAAVSVNLSAADLGDEALLEEIAAHLSRTDLYRDRLLFEMSEATLLSNLGGGRRWMQQLAPAGCRFVRDNFGTGLGMFVLLREPLLDQVKLSRTVMRALAAEQGGRVFVKALRELIETQGKIAVAGYLETPDVLRDVREAGFTWGQGYELRQPSPDLAGLVDEMRAHEPGAASLG
jgi:EAL domain-containing protein (putative c-di-GMP-specific phosphodiesterase class I)